MTTTSWQFLAIQAQTPSGFVWYWRRQRAEETLTSKAFAFYFECIADARGQGYAGVLPAGPKTPLQHLPKEPAQPGLSIRAVSAKEATQRSTRRRSRVT